MTYVLGPAILFGAVFAVMALAACDRVRRTRRWLTANYVLLLVWTPVWHGIAVMA